MKLRPSPSLVVAILALVVAMAGTSYAAVQIGSSQIKNNSVKGKDVKDKSLTGKDVKDSSVTGADVADSSLTGADTADSSLTGADIKDGSLTRADLPATGCAADEFRIATGCLIKATRSVGTLNAALIDCNSLGGRLPTLEETKLLPLSDALTSGVTWTGGMLNQYEFTSEFIVNGGLKVITTDFSGSIVPEDGTIPRGHHCVLDPV
jgi:hypothetical protein